MKKLGIALGALVLIVLIIAGIVVFSIDALAKTAIERGSTYALGVPTTLDSADVGILSGRFTMKGLDVANPEGFEREHFFELGEGHVEVTLGSLREDTVELPILSLAGVNLNLEKKEGKSNFKVITDNLKKFESGEKQTEGEEPGKKFVIREIVITDVNVEVEVLPIGGELNRVKVPIEEIRLTDVGNEGLTTAQTTNLIIQAVLAAVARNAADLPADLGKDLGGALDGLAGLGQATLTETMDVAGKTVENVGKEAEDAAKGIGDTIGEGLGGLLGGKKEE